METYGSRLKDNFAFEKLFLIVVTSNWSNIHIWFGSNEQDIMKSSDLYELGKKKSSANTR